MLYDLQGEWEMVVKVGDWDFGSKIYSPLTTIYPFILALECQDDAQGQYQSPLSH